MSTRLLLSEWLLARTARLRSTRMLPARQLLAIAVLAACLVIVSAIAAFARSTAGQQFARECAQRPTLVGLAAFLCALLFAIRRRAHLSKQYAESWLLPTPIRPVSYRLAIAARLAAGAVATLVIAAAAMTVLLLASGRAVDSWTVLAWMAGAFSLGALVGAFWPVHQRALDHEESRYVFKSRRHAADLSPNLSPNLSLGGLARWPVAKALAWHRPEHSRVLFIVAAVSVPAGTSAFMGVAILAVWSLGSYLFAVARAVPAVAREAALWLRPTVMPFRTFAWAIARRALLHQLVGTIVLCAVLIALGARLADAAYLGAFWLMLAAMTGAIGLQRSYLALPAAGRMLVSLGLALAAESRARGAGLLLASIVTSAHLGVHWGVLRRART